MKNVIYISGPMRGTADLGRRAFCHAEQFLKTRFGWTVLNPAVLPVGMPDERYMPICLAMLREADAIGMLPGWGSSAGAGLEFHYANELGKKIIILEKEYGYDGNERILSESAKEQ